MVVDLLAAAATPVAAVSTEEVSVVDSAAVALVLAVFVAAVWPAQHFGGGAVSRGGGVGFGTPRFGGVRGNGLAQPHIVMGALILPVEVSAEQPVHSDITTEAAARLLLGHTNSADGEINR